MFRLTVSFDRFRPTDAVQLELPWRAPDSRQRVVRLKAAVNVLNSRYGRILTTVGIRRSVTGEAGESPLWPSPGGSRGRCLRCGATKRTLRRIGSEPAACRHVVLENLVMFIRQNNGVLPRKRREGEFRQLRDDEVIAVEGIVADAFGGIDEAP